MTGFKPPNGNALRHRYSAGWNPLELFLAKGPGDRVRKRPEEIGNGRADRGLDETLDRHAGNELERIEPRELVRRDRYADRVIADPGALVRRHVGRYDRDG